MTIPVTTRDFTRIETNSRESLRQRLGDALRFRRGSVPGARSYGSSLIDVLDHNTDKDFYSRVYRAVAEAIRHKPNGLTDLQLQRVRIERGATPQQVNIKVDAFYEGEAVELPVVV